VVEVEVGFTGVVTASTFLAVKLSEDGGATLRPLNSGNQSSSSSRTTFLVNAGTSSFNLLPSSFSFTISDSNVLDILNGLFRPPTFAIAFETDNVAPPSPEAIGKLTLLEFLLPPGTGVALGLMRGLRGRGNRSSSSSSAFPPLDNAVVGVVMVVGAVFRRIGTGRVCTMDKFPLDVVMGRRCGEDEEAGEVRVDEGTEDDPEARILLWLVLSLSETPGTRRFDLLLLFSNNVAFTAVEVAVDLELAEEPPEEAPKVAVAPKVLLKGEDGADIVEGLLDLSKGKASASSSSSTTSPLLAQLPLLPLLVSTSPSDACLLAFAYNWKVGEYEDERR